MVGRISSGELRHGRYHVEALARGLSVLALFSDESRWLSLSEIARSTGLNETTALRLVRTLQAAGFLQQAPLTKRYSLGPTAPKLDSDQRGALDEHEGTLPLVLQALNSFTEDHPEWTPADLARHLGVGEATMSRLLVALAASGYLEQDHQTNILRVGPRPVALTYTALTHMPVRIHALPILADLLEATSLDTTLAVRSGTTAVYIARLNAPDVWPGHSSVGRTVPLHCTAVGKLLLAHLSPEEVDALLRQTGLPRFTDTTITDPAELERELARIRETGLGLDNAEWLPGRGCVAAPLRNAAGQVVAALGASGPVARILAEQESLANLVRDAANRVSYMLGYLRAYY